MQRPVINPYLAVILGVVAVSFSAIFTKLAQAPPVIIAFYRLGLTVLVLAPFLYTGGTRQFRGTGKRDLAMSCLAGVMLALHFTTWIASLNYTSVASSTVLVTMQPLFVIGGGYLLYREKINARGLLGAGLAITGSVLIGVSDFRIGGSAIYGDLLAFAGAGLMAGYMLIGRGIRSRLPLVHYTFMVYGVAALFLLGAALLTGQPLGPYPLMTWVWFAALALFPTILGHTVFNWALRYVKAAAVSVTILGEPVGATILAYFIFHQVPTALQLTGGCITISGLAVFLHSTRKGDS